jgi:type VI secretion system secreted protein Hcp
MKTPSHTIQLSVFLAALLLQPGHAALNAYMEATGEAQGQIRGSVTQAGREDSIEVISLEHQVISPRDPATGQATGKRQHGALKITKELDRSSVHFRLAMTSNENLPEVTIRFWRPSRTGQEEQYYTVQLLNASVSSIRLWKPNTKDADAVRFPDMEEIQFTYERIIWTWNDGGIIAEDSTGSIDR